MRKSKFTTNRGYFPNMELASFYNQINKIKYVY
ncbi:TPA: hypothetical protein PSJ20_002462 [Staphylococcus aureus]|nr:hypothetical protein [Staphylococcus aureus]HDH6406765.1 hypothetical protein [Staphylococcus aureus MRSA-Lux-40]AJP22482.1 hypothetical protein UC16_06590 [Staphylococcus aureus]ATZ14117.1 hypothetical protein CU118_03930 [Staphylococcus aureus]EJX2102328.1 hypothetical protein [Staphylococcus aureus]EKF1402717.1 hypothetical protein [Staphylococcus aureus]